ncbi:myb-like protein Y [Drosophila miranda]|uniref:myb-like protein Y n=1 Tax=Drosophila miranda TaxID=7229 RepID=UPI00143F7C17|nr:myb-like protein Y [Drosophila miranda]
MANSSGGGYTIPTGTLSILPIAANAQLPTITTTASDYEPNDVITTIPVSLSIQRLPSSLSIVDLAQEQDGNSNSGSSNGMTVGPGAGGGGGITTTALLSGKPLNGSGNGNISRNNSFSLSFNLQDPTVRSSVRSAGAPTVDTVDNSSPGGTIALPQSGATATATATSATSTLAKHSPEVKTGEVYV